MRATHRRPVNRGHIYAFLVWSFAVVLVIAVVVIALVVPPEGMCSA